MSSQASHHIPAPDVIKLSDSDEPDSCQFAGGNQASVSFLLPHWLQNRGHWVLVQGC